MDYLNEIEKTELEKFINNATLKEAVRKVILSGVYFNGVMEPGKSAEPLRNFILARFSNPQGMSPASVSIDSDEQLGAKMRSILDAISMVESGFAEIEKLKKTEPEVKDKINKGR